MPKTNSAAVLRALPEPKDKREPRPPKPLTLPEQARAAFAKRNRVAGALGLMWGGTVPFMVYGVSHDAMAHGLPLLSVSWALVAGGLLYSALTVYHWTRTFQSAPKAFGYVVLVEGVMTFAPARLEHLSLLALCILIGVNAIAAAAAISRRAA